MCDWDDVVMIHYAVEPSALQPFVPFELDLRDGKAYVSLVSFTMRRLRPAFGGRLAELACRPIANHEFLNLRTYVRCGRERGIYFLAEWLPNRLSVALGPWMYGLPYRHGRIVYSPDALDDDMFGRVAVDGSGEWAYQASLHPRAELERAEPGSLDEFLLERYTAFTDQKLRKGFFRIWHEPWKQMPITVAIESDRLPASTGAWFKHATLVGAQYSPGLKDVWIGRPHQLRTPGRASYLGYLPLILLPCCALALRPSLPAWGFMWTLAFAIFAGCKWLTWWQARATNAVTNLRRSLAYLFFWPGMDAVAFLNERTRPPKPSRRDWFRATGKTALGAMLMWGLARFVPAQHPLAVGWVGLFGLIFLLHFGIFHLLALGWQRAGVNAPPIMRAPILASSLAEFWGKRWNLGFHKLAHDFLFQPLRRRLGATGATMVVFLASGLVHELVISLPARAGYGLPTLYFLFQGTAIILERGRRLSAPTVSGSDQRIGPLGSLPRFSGRVFTLLVTAGPLFWLFHPPFVNRVILPFLRAIGAIP